MVKILTIETRTAAETSAVGELLGRLAQGGQVLALSGDLGAGKTTFVQGMAVGLGVLSRVTSPTFVLVNDYAAGRNLHLVHVDTYRLGDRIGDILDEAATFGLDDFLDDAAAVVAIEWAERIEPLLPADSLRVEIDPAADAPDTRVIRLTATGPQSERLLAAVAEHSASLPRPESAG